MEENLNKEVRYYFDITDVVQHSIHGGTLTGIQRVVLGVLKEIRFEFEDIDCCCVVHHFSKNKTVFFKLDLIFKEPTDTHDTVFNRLKFLEPFTKTTFKYELKKYLLNYQNNTTKIIKKAQMKFLYVFWRKGLVKHGLVGNSKDHALSQYSQPLGKIYPKDKLVFLGLQLTSTPITQLARTHRMQGGKVICLVHDLIAIKQPDFFPQEHSILFKSWLDKAIIYTSNFLCVSHSTKNDLKNYCELNNRPSNIEVVHLAHEFKGSDRNKIIENEEIELRFGLTKNKFVLCVGTVEIRKNGARLLQAWSLLSEEFKERLPKLVFIGNKGWLIDEFEKLLKDHQYSNPNPQIVWFNGVSDAELAWLYSNSYFTIYPSLYEGWGLPVGEAAWFGKYTITSKTSSMPEICGNLLDYVDPYNENELASKIAFLLKNPTYLHEKETAIRHSPLRTWNMVSNELINFILTI